MTIIPILLFVFYLVVIIIGAQAHRRWERDEYRWQRARQRQAQWEQARRHARAMRNIERQAEAEYRGHENAQMN